MDVDLSTDLNHIPELIKAIEDGCHIAIGSRLAKGARVKRSLKREFISRSYSTLIRAMFFTPFRDAQCGFKALSRDTVKALVPLVKDNNWFFDSELLIIANSSGFRIKEIPRLLEGRPGQPGKDYPDGLGGCEGAAGGCALEASPTWSHRAWRAGGTPSPLARSFRRCLTRFLLPQGEKVGMRAGPEDGLSVKI